MINAVLSAADPWAGTPINFVPVWLADTWRFIFWVTCIPLTVHLLADSIGRGIPLARRLGRLALLVFVVRAAYAQMMNWNAPLILESLPVNTIAAALAWGQVLAYRREREARQGTDFHLGSG